MRVKLLSIFLGSATSVALTLLLWAFRGSILAYLLLWLTWPGWLLAWGTIIALGGEGWEHFDAIGRSLITVGNAACFSWAYILISTRKRREVLKDRSSQEKGQDRQQECLS